MPEPNPFEVIRGALYGLHIAAHLESADADGERDDALAALALLGQQMGEAREVIEACRDLIACYPPGLKLKDSGPNCGFDFTGPYQEHYDRAITALATQPTEEGS